MAQSIRRPGARCFGPGRADRGGTKSPLGAFSADLDDVTKQGRGHRKRAAQKRWMQIHLLELIKSKPAELKSVAAFRAFVRDGLVQQA